MATASGAGAATERQFRSTPQALAAARTAAARSAKFDRSTIRDRAQPRPAQRLDRARARYRLCRASTPQTHERRSDAGGAVRLLARGRAERSLLRAARPSPRRRRRAAAACSAATSLPDQIPEGAALEALKPLLTDPGVLKIGAGRQIRLADLRAARHRDRVLRRHDADVLCARRRPREPRAGRARRAHFNHAAIDLNALIKPGKTRITFDAVAIERATEYAAESGRRRVAALARAQAAACRRARAQRSTRRWSGRSSAVLARMERRGISIDREVLSRLSGEFAQEAAGARSRDQRDRRRGRQSRQPEAARRHSVRQARPARRHQDQDRPMVDRRARARGARRAGPRAAAEDPRLAAGVEAEIDLHRRAARLRQSDDATASIPTTRSPRPRPGGCRRPIPTCRTSRSAPRTAARSAAPSSPRRA